MIRCTDSEFTKGSRTDKEEPGKGKGMKICYNCFNDIPDSAKTCPRCGSSADLRNGDKYPHALPCGAVLDGRYIVGRVLGQGGFGITYAGQQFDTKELVAIKEYFPGVLATRDASRAVVPVNSDRIGDFEYGEKQFLDEARTLAAFIGSPNIVRVHSYFEENGTAYFVMEYVRGKSLKQYVESCGGRISWEETWDLLMPVLEALSEVHSKKIIHRDIKPDNIIITEDGSAKLIDFGAARYRHGEKSRSLTAVLTPGYAPPEQYYSSGDQGAWTDVYALAATMYFSITGKTPPESIGRERASSDSLEKPSSLGIAIPAYAEAALLKALSVKEKERYETTYDFRNAVLEGKRREEKKGDVKSPPPDRDDIFFRETQKKAAGGDADSQYLLGFFYEKGKGTARNYQEAEKWYRLAAAQGNAEARMKLDERTSRDGDVSDSGKKNKGPSKTVVRKKGEAGGFKKIILALGLIVLIAVAGIVISNRNRSQSTVTDTGGSEQINERADENGGQEAPSLQEEKEEEEPEQTSRTSDAPMELTDTWEEIAAAGRDGTYKERYRIGDTKELDMGSEGIITMKLAAMDEDELADGSGKAPMTWVADECLQSLHNMNSEDTSEGGWEASGMRAWLRETVLPLMPKEVRNNIREVTKYSYFNDEQKVETSKDTIWIPSLREVELADQYEWVNDFYEKEGVAYTSVFMDDESRMRSRDGESGASQWWWLRSVAYSSAFMAVDGYVDEADAGYEGGVVVGFCF